MNIRIFLKSVWMLFLPLIGHTAEYNFRLHHELPASSVVQTQFLQPWADKIEEQSQGRIKIDIYPLLSLGGTSEGLAQQVTDGDVDIVWTVEGYTPGRYPRTEVFGLPTVHFRSAYATNRSIYSNLDLIKDDFKDVKPLVIHSHAGNAMHIVGKGINTPEEIKGMRVCCPSRTGAWMLEAFGAEVVQMPLIDVKDEISKKKLDIAFLPFEVMPPLGLTEVELYSVFGKDGSRFGTDIFLLLMNQKAFDSLPPDLQKIIEDSTGLEMYKSVGVIWDEFEIPGYEAQHSRLRKLDLNEMVVFETLAQQAVDRWIEEVGKQGIDGQTLVNEARRYVRRYSRLITSVDSNL